jgi:hypothetical protein
MAINSLVNLGQGSISGFGAVSSGNFNFMDFVEGAILGGFASEDRFQSSEDLSKTVGKRSSQDLGKQLGSIAWDTAAMFVPAPLRGLFAAGNVIEAIKEALSGNGVDAVQNLLMAGMQLAGVKGPKDLGAKIAAKNPAITRAVKELADDIPKNIQLKASLKNTPTPMQLKKPGALTEYGTNPLSRKDVVDQIRSTNQSINTNAGIVNQELKQEASKLTARAAQKTGSWWQHVSSNFNAGRSAVA